MSNTILILVANPVSTSRLRLDQEVREIESGLLRSRHRDQFKLTARWAVRPNDIRRAMLDVEPQIVHFSGHGAGGEGLVFEDNTGQPMLISGEALAGLFSLFSSSLDCVILSGCYSELQAHSIAQHINYVIGMKQSISDEAAIEFAIGFYDALGAGKSIEFAYRLACNAITLSGAAPDNSMPVLIKKKGLADSSDDLPKEETSKGNWESDKQGLKVFMSYSHRDERLRDELAKHLSLLVRQNVIQSWHDRSIAAGSEWANGISTHLESANIILLLISSDFLASDYCYDMEMNRAMEKHESGNARVIPIILRPVDWKGSPFSKLQALPTDARPITSWENLDLGFSDVARGIRLVCEEILRSVRLRAAIINQETTPPEIIENIESSKEIFQLFDVFKTSGVPTVTFVEPEKFNLMKLALLQPGVGVVIEGPSGIGKTTAVRKALDETAATSERVEVRSLSARNPKDFSAIETIRQWHKREVILIDDFHRLDEKLQDGLVDYLKYLADNELPKKLIIVGIPSTGKRLVKLAGDIATRVKFFKLGKVSDETTLKMIRKGEAALNIRFDHPTEIARTASGSLNIAQFLCYHLLAWRGITETQRNVELIAAKLEVAISEVVNNELALKFEDTVRCFASLDGYKEVTCVKLLVELSRSPEGFLSLKHMRDNAPELADGIDKFIEQDYMAALYQECPESKGYLLFDRKLSALIVDDPQLVFYLVNTPADRLSRLVGKNSWLS